MTSVDFFFLFIYLYILGFLPAYLLTSRYPLIYGI